MHTAINGHKRLVGPARLAVDKHTHTHTTKSVIPSRLKPGGDNEWSSVVSSSVSVVQPFRSEY